MFKNDPVNEILKYDLVLKIYAFFYRKKGKPKHEKPVSKVGTSR